MFGFVLTIASKLKLNINIFLHPTSLMIILITNNVNCHVRRLLFILTSALCHHFALDIFTHTFDGREMETK